ncbi:transposable element Tcb1 transposase [Trichonephila clavipes]|nr:transposable element Tcb1 transposase [Trichonephila clavipes]
MEARWPARQAARQLGRFDCVGTSVSERCHLHEDQAQDAIDRPVVEKTVTPRARRNWTAAEWNQVVFSDEFRFNLNSDDNRVRVWRPRGERLNPDFALQRHTAPTAGVMTWGVISCNTLSLLVLIRGTMTTQRYVHDILQPHVLPLIQRLLEAIFQQDGCSNSQGKSVMTVSVLLLPFIGLPDPQICLQSSISQIIGDGDDEVHFWLNSYVNKQNCRIWSDANAQVYVETPLHPEKRTVWCALWAGAIIGPYIFKNDEGHNVTVNGDRYRAMITNFFIPELNNHDVQELWFQQDGATCHTARATIDLLKDTFGDRLILRFGPVNWPPRSCDLTPLDYFLWAM